MAGAPSSAVAFERDVTFERMQGVFQRFFQAVDGFNAQKWDAVEKLLHKNVVVFNVNHLNYIIGIREAMKYFRGLPKDAPPQFVPTSMVLEPGIYPLSVSGGALWTDKRHNHVDRPIQYSFLYEPGTFLITSLWATHSD